MEEIRFLETHGDIFLGGKNLGKKHRSKAVNGAPVGIAMKWNDTKRRCEMVWNGELAYILEGNVAYWVPEKENKEEVVTKNEHRTESVEGRKRAQVSTPTGHVFEGEGSGKRRQ